MFIEDATQPWSHATYPLTASSIASSSWSLIVTLFSLKRQAKVLELVVQGQAHIYTYIHTYAYAYTHTHTHTHAPAHTHSTVHVHISIQRCLSAQVVYSHVHMNKQTNTHKKNVVLENRTSPLTWIRRIMIVDFKSDPHTAENCDSDGFSDPPSNLFGDSY